MRRAVVLGVLAALVVAAAAAPAPAATPADRKIASLQRQVRTLQKEVRALQREVRTLRALTVANYAADACLTASVADVLQATWATVDAYTFAQTGERIFRPEEASVPVRVDDRGACRAARVVRPANTDRPTTGVFEAIARFLFG